MTIIESVVKWLATCPDLADGYINIDWLPEDAREYAVDVVPCNEIIRRYITGGAKKQFLFYLSTRAFLTGDIRDAQDVYRFYESFAEWVQQQNRNKNLPELGARRTACCVRITTSGYVMQAYDNGKVRYQIQLRLEYEEE